MKKQLAILAISVSSLFILLACSDLMRPGTHDENAMYNMLSLRYSEGTASLRSLQASLYLAIEKGLDKKAQLNKEKIWSAIQRIRKDLETIDARANSYLMDLSRMDSDQPDKLTKRAWRSMTNSYTSATQDVKWFCQSANNDTTFPVQQAWERASINISSFSDTEVTSNIFNNNAETKASTHLLLHAYRQQMSSLETTFLLAITSALQEMPILDPGYQILTNASNSFIEIGDNYTVELSVGKQDIDLDYEIKVNGFPLSVQNGKAIFRERAHEQGTHSYLVDISFKNPITNLQEQLQQVFQYRADKVLATVTISDRNILYMGIDNPISVDLTGIDANEIALSITNAGIDATIEQQKGNQYIARVSKLTPLNESAYITIENLENQKIIGRYPFQVRPLPTPIPEVIFYAEKGLVDAKVMREQEEIRARLEGFEFNEIQSAYTIESFTLFYIAKGKELIAIPCIGPRFNPEVRRALRSAKSGDAYIFSKIKVSCSGDIGFRELSSLGYIIK